MENFTYYAPTKIIFGKDTESQVGNLCNSFNVKKVLIHYGSGSVVKSGLLERVKKSLKCSNVEYLELGGVVPNPRLSLVRTGIELCRKNNIDFILAVGGGSVIDSAKAIAFGSPNNDDVWDYYLGKKQIVKCLGIGTILTLSAAGSEMSDSSVISDDSNNNLKLSYGHSLGRPKFSILNPSLTCTLPNYQTSCGAVDIIMHTFERFFSNVDPLQITDDIAISVVKNIIKYTPIALSENNNYEARAQIMWTGSLSHNDLTGCGGISDWATHEIEHTLSGEWDVAHGAGLSAVWGSWARYVYKDNVSRFCKIGNEIFGLKDTNEEVALKTIQLIEDFFVSINMPINITQLGFKMTEELACKLSNIATNNARKEIGNFKKLNCNDVKSILLLAK